MECVQFFLISGCRYSHTEESLSAWLCSQLNTQLGSFVSFYLEFLRNCLKFFLMYLFIHFWLHWVSMLCSGFLWLQQRLGVALWLWEVGFSLWCLLLQSTDSRCTGSAVSVHGLSFSMPCEIFPDLESNLCSLLWQVDSSLTSIPILAALCPPFFCR